MQWLQLLAQAPEAGEGALWFGGGMVLVSLILGVSALLLWIFALVDAIKNPALNSNERLIWVLVIVLTNWIGALIYLLVGRKRKA